MAAPVVGTAAEHGGARLGRPARPHARRARRGLRRHRHQPALHDARGLRPCRRAAPERGRRARRALARLLVADPDRHASSTSSSSCAPTTAARAACWRSAPWPPAPCPSTPALRRLVLALTHRRPGPVLRRRPDHARDLGALRGRGPGDRRTRRSSPTSCRSPPLVLLGLFLIQSRGTASVGPALRPGDAGLVRDPGPARAWPRSSRTRRVLAALDPRYAVGLFGHAGWQAFVALGAIVLAVTGAEALYADMGHFGRSADPPRLVRPRPARPGPQLFRPGRAAPARARGARAPVLPPGPGLGCSGR